MDKHTSQLMQDLFVLSETDFKNNGYFVEMGATNGKKLSNSYLLETEFDWNGILVEPARVWHERLEKNRSVNIDTRCVWKNSGEKILFNECGQLSTIDSFSSLGSHTRRRKSGTRYNVKTISLLDLLEEYQAPQQIDYLSIDTEGSEFEILNSFNFSRYRFNVITCEHNYKAQREQIQNLLNRNGYVRKYQKLSKFDDWYIHSESTQH